RPVSLNLKIMLQRVGENPDSGLRNFNYGGDLVHAVAIFINAVMGHFHLSRVDKSVPVIALFPEKEIILVEIQGLDQCIFNGIGNDRVIEIKINAGSIVDLAEIRLAG